MAPADKSATANGALRFSEGLTLLRRWEPTPSVLISLYATLVTIADYCVWRVDGAGLADWVAIRADIGRMLRKRRMAR